MKLISKAGLVILAASMAAFYSCNKVKDAVAITIPMTQSDILFDIPPQAAAGETEVPAGSAHVNVDSFVHAYNAEFAASNIRDVKVESVQVDILNGSAANHWGHLESGSARLSTNENTTPVTIAEINNNPADPVTSLIIPATNASLSNYFHATDFTYYLKVKTRTPVTDTLHCKATIRYTITAGL